MTSISQERSTICANKRFGNGKKSFSLSHATRINHVTNFLDPVHSIRCARPTGPPSNADGPGTLIDRWTRNRMAKVSGAARTRCNVTVHIKIRRVYVGNNLDYDANTNGPHHLS